MKAHQIILYPTLNKEQVIAYMIGLGQQTDKRMWDELTIFNRIPEVISNEEIHSLYLDLFLDTMFKCVVFFDGKSSQPTTYAKVGDLLNEYSGSELFINKGDLLLSATAFEMANKFLDEFKDQWAVYSLPLVHGKEFKTYDDCLVIARECPSWDEALKRPDAYNYYTSGQQEDEDLNKGWVLYDNPVDLNAHVYTSESSKRIRITQFDQNLSWGLSQFLHVARNEGCQFINWHDAYCLHMYHPNPTKTDGRKWYKGNKY